MQEHEPYMRRCYELAELAAREGESPVGSVLVKNGVVIGEGYEKSRQLNDITRHAEVVALLDALKTNRSLEGAVLYSNVEPCMLCSYVIRHHRIKEVVFARHSGELGGTRPPCNLLTAGDFSSWGEPPVITVYKALYPPN
jgi:tRNA(Arg) A34 adenosine deaminase TadA